MGINQQARGARYDEDVFMSHDGLELNLVSEPSAASAPPSRSKKRGGGKAWAKKKKKQSQAQADQQPHDSSANQARTGSGPPTTTTTTTTSAQGKSQEASPAASPAQPTAKSPGGQDDGRKSDTSNKDTTARSPHHPVSTNTSEAAVAAVSARRAGPRLGADASSQSSSAAHRSPKARNKPGAVSGDGTPKEPSNERRRVLEMAGRGTTSKPSRGAQGEEKRGGTKRASPSSSSSSPSSTSLSSSARATKRKRPTTGSPGPVSSDGVIDFTGGDNALPSMKVDPKRPDKNRRAVATAAAVAKATAAMAKAGGKWWDDDDDDHVVAAKARASTPASSTSNGGWSYGASGVGGGGGRYGGYGSAGQSGEEVEEDKDGGLPSDIHPNSVRTKAVDMGGEASKAMEILSALMESGAGGAGALGGSKRVKNGGKSKKKARQPTEPEEEQSTGIPDRSEPSGVDTAVVGTRVVGVADALAEDEREEAVAVPSPDDEGTAEENSASTEAAAGSGSGGGGGSGQEAEKLQVLGSRKNRGRINNATDDGSTCGTPTVPLPEYHARPRELSRRAAAKPLASARSGHVMAVGPGATFAGLNLPPKMVSHLEEPKGDLGGGGMGLAGPTVCQLASVPVLAAGHNTVVKSETGSGKTLAYLLPMLCDLAAMEPRVEREKGTLAIVLAPTRELSAQILEVLSRVVRPFIWLVPGSISGGERRKSEKARLRKGVTILVCTPGRLLDHLKTTKCFRRDSMRWLILDEADRLLDLGFEKQVKEIVELLDQSAKAIRSGAAGSTRVQGGVVVPSIKVIRRQTVMVSATLEKGVSRLAAVLLSKYMRVDADANFVESVDESGKATLISGERGASKSKGDTSQRAAVAASAEEFSTPRQLVQYYMTVTQKLRLPALCSFLRARAREKVVVFMSTCDAVDFHHDLFRRAGWPGDAPLPSALAAVGSQGGSEGRGVAGEEARQGGEQGGVDGGGGGSATADKSGKKKADGDIGDSGFFGAGCLVRRLHGNVPQIERQKTYRAFGAAKSGVLICTDVAARGLDLPTVDWIVQYDPPAETADYVHRVGRTARKGERGHSLLFLLPREAAYLGVLEARGLRPKPLSLEGVLCAADAGKRDARRADEQLAYELQQGLQLLVAGEKSLLDRARAAFQSHVRAYAARAPDSRAVFQVRSLHLGHVARSFALKDPPTAVKVGKRVVRRPGYVKGSNRGGDKVDGSGGEGGAGSERGEKRRRDGAGGSGGSVHRLGLSKQTELASRAEFM